MAEQKTLVRRHLMGRRQFLLHIAEAGETNRNISLQER